MYVHTCGGGEHVCDHDAPAVSGGARRAAGRVGQVGQHAGVARAVHPVLAKEHCAGHGRLEPRLGHVVLQTGRLATETAAHRSHGATAAVSRVTPGHRCTNK